MSEPEPTLTAAEVALNALIFQELNFVPHEPPKTTAEAVDSLAFWIRRAGLGVMCGLLEVAKAIKERGEA